MLITYSFDCVIQAKNPTFILVTLSSVCETLLVSGVTTFGSKIAQQLFNIDLATAGTVIGNIILIILCKVVVTGNIVIVTIESIEL